MTKKELQEILTNHAKWLVKKESGVYADLSGADLSGANLRCADIRGANLRGADLSGAKLDGANLSGAKLSGANLRGADLLGVDLRGADLRGANLRCADIRAADLHGADFRDANLRCADIRAANLRGVDFRDANLRDAKLSGADLSGADLRGANLNYVKHNEFTSFFAIQCPEEGAFTAFKKVCKDGDAFIVKLKVPADARRNSATSRKCRCEKAEVVAILNIDGSDSGLSEIYNRAYSGLTYKVGEMVFADSWDDDRWAECSHGIHFFITFNEAVNH